MFRKQAAEVLLHEAHGVIEKRAVRHRLQVGALHVQSVDEPCTCRRGFQMFSSSLP